MRLPRGLAWLAVATLLALPAWWVGVVTPDSMLLLHPATPQGAGVAGSLWSAAWGHLSEAHLRLNLAGCFLVGLLGMVLGARPRHAAAWLLAWPLTHALLLADTRLAWYGGASGVLHAGVAVVVVAGWRRHRGLSAVLGSALIAKVAHEALKSRPVMATQHLDIPVATLSHGAGTLAGFACAALILAGFHRARLPVSPPGA